MCCWFIFCHRLLLKVVLSHCKLLLFFFLTCNLLWYYSSVYFCLQEEDRGTSDGTFKNERLFKCPPKRALFVKISSCRPDSRFQSTSANHSQRMLKQEDRGENWKTDRWSSINSTQYKCCLFIVSLITVQRWPSHSTQNSIFVSWSYFLASLGRNFIRHHQQLDMQIVSCVHVLFVYRNNDVHVRFLLP